jgi:hypothetical protein
MPEGRTPPVSAIKAMTGEAIYGSVICRRAIL